MKAKRVVGGLALSLAAALGSCGGGGGGGGGPIEPPPGAQTGSVKGVVRDDAGDPVANATVQLAATGKTTLVATTASDGSYRFATVATGVWQVLVVAPTGYSGGTTPSVTVSANQEATVGAIVLTKAGPGSVPTIVNVSAYNLAFTPGNVTIKAGGTVHWKNLDGEQHTVTGSGFNSLLDPGEQYTRQFNSAGSYNYECTIHNGMTGTVVVVP